MTDPYGVHPGETAAPAADPLVDTDGTWAMPPDTDGPCRTWPLAPGLGCLTGPAAGWDAAQRFAVEDATDTLWRLTAGRYGMCRVTVRPGHQAPGPGCCSATLVWPASPVVSPTGSGCHCSPQRVVQLPGPVVPGREVQVWLDGAQLTTGYRLLPDGRLLRGDGQPGWPGCQQLDRPLQPDLGGAQTPVGTFGILYWRGLPVPAGGQRAVALLACELYRAATGDDQCRIPARVELVEREGVTYRQIDRQAFLDKGRVGITEIDQWLAAVNPRGRRSPPGVFSPDDPPLLLEHRTGEIL